MTASEKFEGFSDARSALLNSLVPGVSVVFLYLLFLTGVVSRFGGFCNPDANELRDTYTCVTVLLVLWDYRISGAYRQVEEFIRDLDIERNKIRRSRFFFFVSRAFTAMLMRYMVIEKEMYGAAIILSFIISMAASLLSIGFAFVTSGDGL